MAIAIDRLLGAPRRRAVLRRLRRNAHVPFQPDPASPLVVSLTSFPARMKFVWRAIESIFLQETKPARVVLVLSREEFPDEVLPQAVEMQCDRGLEILWTAANTRAYKKLLPTQAAYPKAHIVTIDDDVVYHPWLLTRLLEASRRNPAAVIGCRGRLVRASARQLAPYTFWPMAGPDSPRERIVLTGVGGILYPPQSLAARALQDIGLAGSLCPTADDFWFWACARLVRALPLCLGESSYHSFYDAEQTDSLFSINGEGGMNDAQFQRLCDHFGLWKMLDTPG